ncbi:helix-turn-helix transcriptional regulator [Leuconostoc gelidum subsp. gelidum]|uniref:Helix-turn-helix transcriptional regulator n=2 Tax=Leuconostoc TaxID=1243 RepID=A0AB35FYQ7_LEUGE|nr:MULTISPECIES: helix-turn-helix transcriptional regulator [Leuconostoc gelidum group]MBZ5961043.1 helix-turn-helix transcriptional regulator [Leuconostoc gasicomitatum]MBZ5969516.1 helix-turn-helix transcriptional regulator [Leuconostoc gasicomitatum]MBZ5974915.1 helix-turn-helix transcriptional regulator [Leuconostoc gelidum subsp. gelidum]MBZ5994537.1 helix-turn-helix transcriptional regulator [Leuconostoc gasicomitatum]MBZ6015490.1 helix-turn-helix transcriptional regulator [Leuconostoc g
MTLLSRTKDMTKLRGLSLDDVASRAGLSHKSIYNWGRNNPKSENLDKVANVLHVSTDYLLGRTDEMNLSITDSQKELDIKNALEHDIMLSFDGKPISEKYKRIILELLSEED